MSSSSGQDEREEETNEDWIDEGAEEKLFKNGSSDHEKGIHEHIEQWDKCWTRNESPVNKPAMDKGVIAKKRLNYVFDTYCMFKNFEEERLIQKNISRRVKRLETELDKVMIRLKNLQEGNITRKCSTESIEIPCGSCDEGDKDQSDKEDICKKEEAPLESKTICENDSPAVESPQPVQTEQEKSCLEGGREEIDNVKPEKEDIKLVKESEQECKDKKQHKCPIKLTYYEDEPYIIKKPIPTPRVKKPKVNN